MTKKALMIGDNCIDVYKDLNYYYLTGNVVDTGVNMSMLGTKVGIITNVAKDKYGQEMLSLFERNKMMIDKIRLIEGETAYTLMELKGNDRVHGDYFEGVLKDIKFTDSDLEYSLNYDLVFSAYWGKAEELFIKLSNLKERPIIAFDYADRYQDKKVKLLDGVVDIGFFSWDKEIEDAKVFMQERLDKGMKVCICTFGAGGSMAYDGNEYYRKHAEKVKHIENTVGAGDSFIAGFLHSYLNNEPISLCLKSGAELASKIIEQFTPILYEPVYEYLKI